ncbi:sulfopyruvate decarboxylase subunit beta [Methanobacterium subterraneum]|uniref:sulfopyruvate decarboxylase n=1 Tax=Methanobacterium subterraneum TaxID=59277 RepID=A0A2H4VBW4_9EURY|nr:sulfopyruvate decarboxylase subunit beta [Methanobacterium subterraneum]AUB55569.1 sulfopyruvate decarboxylase subunit beta [Methanobacterium subterraneum]MBW4258355.1 sulfopyruvate decarboxylase subunit beta [Methanobacterium sp. YSL]PKL71080.1 MAG: sulfopyruvate decarboxylase subunit beta [Methanobacteriales archaeon HGW-Methanobacteriales-2]
MERINALEQITKQLEDELVICNIGFPSRELYHVKDSSKHFYMMGSMGMASSIGLGLAMAQDRKVIVFDGDGSLLMNLGSLVTIYNQSPENMVLVVLDNECYGSTGNQCTYSSTTNLKKVAEGVGFKNTVFYQESSEEIDFTPVLEMEGPVFVHVKVKAGNASVPVIPMEPEEIKERFMGEVQGN